MNNRMPKILTSPTKNTREVVNPRLVYVVFPGVNMYIYVRGELTRFCIVLARFPCALDFRKLFKTETIQTLLKSSGKMALFLYANIHQGDELFSVHSRGKQCAFMSLSLISSFNSPKYPTDRLVNNYI